MDPWREFWEAISDEVRREVSEELGVDYVSFVSYSKGRGRKRRNPQDVELVEVGRGRYRLLVDDPDGELLQLAQEALGDTVDERDVNLWEEFVRRLRRLKGPR